MAALQLAHEVLALKTHPELRHALTKNDVDSEEIRHRIQSMNDLIDTVLTPQEKLF